MKNRQIYPICAAILILACCTPKVEPIQFEVPEVEYTVQQDKLSVSVGEPMTFGAKERLDCAQWAQWAAERFGPDCRILLFGISMGAATVLLASALDLPQQVRGVVADCPFSNGRDILVRVASNAGVPRFLAAHLAHLTCALWGWFDLDDTDVREAVKRTRVPILLIHGEDDDFVPPEMSAELLSCNPTMAERHTFPGASHGVSYVIDPERYEKLVLDFARRVGMEVYKRDVVSRASP